MKVNKRILVTILLVSALVLVASCGKKNDNVLRIARSNVYVAATSQIMQEKKILEKYLPEGMSVEWNVIATGPDLREALVSGQADIADFSLMTFITGYENSLPLTLMSFCGSTPINIYSCDGQKTSLVDFCENDLIAITNRATNLHIAYLAQCKKELGKSVALDNNLSPIPASEALAAIQTGDDYAGAVFSFPMYVKAEKIEKVTKIADMAGVIKEYCIGDAFVANSEFYEKNPDIIDAFINAQKEAVEFIKNNPKEASQILANIYGVEPEVVENVIGIMPPSMEVTGYDLQAELLYEAGILKKQPTKFVDLHNYNSIVK